MAKKKAKKKAKGRSTKRAKPSKKAKSKRGVKKAARKTTKKVARRKRAKKAARKSTKKTARKVTRKVARAAKPKPPRRTKHVAPPTRITPPPVVDVTPMPPPAPPPISFPDPFGPPAEGEPGDRSAPARSGAGARVGDPAPDFELPDESGRTHTLAQYRGQRVVLYFYPKDDTPGCTAEACGFRNRLGAFADRRAAVLGVSPDTVESHQRFAQKYGLTFPLLADKDHQVAAQYGVWVEQERAGQKSMGIARTTFIIDENGRVAHVFRNVRPDGHEEEVLRQLVS